MRKEMKYFTRIKSEEDMSIRRVGSGIAKVGLGRGIEAGSGG